MSVNRLKEQPNNNRTMKRTILFIMILVTATLTFAQSPNAFNYQAVVRDSEGEILAESEVSFRISILETAEDGTPVYVETHTVSTNAFGVVNFRIGDGDPQTGNIEDVTWGEEAYFLKVELDPNGGSDFLEMTTQQLVAVPYAMHANTVTNSDNDESNELQTLSKDGDNITLSQGGGSVSVADQDSDPKNEIQELSTLGEEIKLSDGGGSVSLSDLGHWQKKNTDLYYQRGNVAIGTDIPHADLNLVGDSVIFNIGPSGTQWNKSAAGMIRFSEAGDYENGLCGFQFYHNGEQNKLTLEGGCLSVKDTLITFNRTGRIGIHTYDPQYDFHVNADMAVKETIRHAGDGNTNLTFGTDEVRLHAGGKQMIKLAEAGQDTIILGDGSDVDISLNKDIYIDHAKKSVGFFNDNPSEIYAIHSSGYDKQGGIYSFIRYQGSSDAFAGYNSVNLYNGSGKGYGMMVNGYKSSTTTGKSSFYGYATDINNYGDGATYGMYHDVNTHGSFTYPIYGTYVIAHDYQDGTSSDRYSYGVYTKAHSYYSAGTSHVKGIYSSYMGTNADTKYAGYFAGSVYTTGSYLPSDRTLKLGVTSHTSSLDKIMSLKVYDYSYDTVRFQHLNLPSGTQTGFIAQEFKVQFPELTTKAVQAPLTEEEIEAYKEQGLAIPEMATEQVEFTSVNYAGLVPHLAKAIQEQQTMIASSAEQIQSQQEMIAQLMAQVAALQEQLEQLKTGDQ